MKRPADLLRELESSDMRTFAEEWNGHLSARRDFDEQERSRLVKLGSFFAAQKREELQARTDEIRIDEDEAGAITVSQARGRAQGILAVQLLSHSGQIKLGEIYVAGGEKYGNVVIATPNETPVRASALVSVNRPRGTDEMAYVAEVDPTVEGATEARLLVWQAFQQAAHQLDSIEPGN